MYLSVYSWRYFIWKMIELTDEQYEEWRNALLNAQAGSSFGVKEFASKYPELYKHISAMLRKRTKLRSTLEAYKSVSEFIYWGHLTWDDEHNEESEETKRQQALRFFAKYFKLYCFVEEYGEENERYHIHFFGVLKSKSITYEMMYQGWHSRIKMECLKTYSERIKKIRYLTKYCVKQVPRIRMDKRSIALLKDYKQYKHMVAIGFESFKEEYDAKVLDLHQDIDLPF